eukprot:CAMPEP_0178919874 /NCGR_PEP_ID=MMETSP0786-20121207/14683_1 /TAXON_ID=186022 /ORGANISM="Thalassionema frauenfeldii, Strain CCMP 1798" /LENGTH=364 /DNA_ID=CAMNT_0020593861 /DNA_START=9 /DNA_END=1103 /DNA_ORIENTATION=+
MIQFLADNLHDRSALQCPSCDSIVASHNLLRLGKTDAHASSNGNVRHVQHHFYPAPEKNVELIDETIEARESVGIASEGSKEQNAELDAAQQIPPKKRKPASKANENGPQQKKRRKSSTANATKKGSPSIRATNNSLPSTNVDSSVAETTGPSLDGGNTAGAEREVTEEASKEKKVYKRRKTFEERLQALADYKDKHGDCYVPHAYKLDRSLGEWVKDVRRGHLKVTMDQRKLLNAVGFVWETRFNRREREWNAILEKLQSYKERFGDCRVPWKFEEDPSLSEWVRTQRKLNKKGNLRDDRKKALDSIGFVWFDGKNTVPQQDILKDDNVQQVQQWDATVDAAQQVYPSLDYTQLQYNSGMQYK